MWAAGAGAAVLSAVGIYGTEGGLWRDVAVTPRFRSITVGEVRDETAPGSVLGRGLTAAIGHELDRLEGVTVVTGLAPTGGRLPAAAGTRGTDLGAESVLDLSLGHASNSVVLTARLIDSRTGETVWHDRFTRDVSELPLLQDTLAGSVAASLRSRLAPRRRTALSAGAYDAYLRARALWETRRPDDLLAARTLYERAVTLEPTYAEAYAGLANTYTLLSAYGVLPKSDMAPKAKAAAERAIALDDQLAEAHTALAYVLVEDWDWPDGEREYRRAIELDPNDALAHHWYALTTAYHRPEEAVAAIERARELDPLSQAIDVDMGVVYLRATQIDKAIAHLTRAATLYPDSIDARVNLAQAYYQRNQPELAVAPLQEALRIQPDQPFALAWLGLVYAEAGRTADTRAVLEHAKTIAASLPAPSFLMAALNGALGEKDEAIRWIRVALDQREDWASGIGGYAWFKRLHGDPRFEAILLKTASQRRY